MLLGRRKRFEALFLPLLDRLLAASIRRSPSREAAEDLVQEAYLRAWIHLDQLQDPALAYTWLYRILLNVIADHYRKEHRRQTLVPVTTLEGDYDQLLADPDPGPFDQLMRRIEQGQLRAALDHLPEEFAEVVSLRDLDGLRYREIAELTAVPIGTVMSRLSRGRKLLAALLLRESQRDQITPIRRDR